MAETGLVLVFPLRSTLGGSKEMVTATVAGNCTWHNSDRRSDFDRANLVVLQHLDEVDPFMALHKEIIAKKYRDRGVCRTSHHSHVSRPHISEHAPPCTINQTTLSRIVALSFCGPRSCVLKLSS